MLYSPIKISGKKVVLIPDFIRSTRDGLPDSNYILAEDIAFLGARSYVSESDIEDVRGDYPDIAVYGLWQTIIKSDLIDEVGNYFISNGDNYTGFILNIVEEFGQLKVAECGVVVNGYSSLTTPFSTEDIKEISFENEKSSLLLPDAPSHTKKELYRIKKENNRKGWTVVAVASIFTLTIFTCYWFYMDEEKREMELAIDRQEAIYDELRQKADRLKKSRVSGLSGYLEKVLSLHELIMEDASLKTVNVLYGTAVNPQAIKNSYERGIMFFETEMLDASDFYSNKNGILVIRSPGKKIILKIDLNVVGK